jgi:cytosine/adenosine deaminase-related metal-dependent hydrolase
MSIERILLKGGCVLTLDPDIGNYRTADVLIEGSKITSIGPRLKVSDAEVIDASDMIVMPGFIDTHRHIWEGILKNIAPTRCWRSTSGTFSVRSRPSTVRRTPTPATW